MVPRTCRKQIKASVEKTSIVGCFNLEILMFDADANLSPIHKDQSRYCLTSRIRARPAQRLLNAVPTIVILEKKTIAIYVPDAFENASTYLSETRLNEAN